MLQGYIENKEERDRLYYEKMRSHGPVEQSDMPAKRQKSDQGPRNEGADSTPSKDEPVDVSDARDKQPPDAPRKNVSIAVPESDAATRRVGDEIEAAAKPSIDVELEYGGIPTGAPLSMKALVTATPPVGSKPKAAEVVLILDESLSMGHRSNSQSAAALLGQFCEELFEHGVPGVELSLRVLLFGGEVVDKKIGTTELVMLNDKSREQFLEIARDIDGRQGSTAIGEPILQAIQILKDHREEMLNCVETGTATQDDIVPVQHIVTLTDGGANAGAYTNGHVLHDKLKEEIGSANIFCHFIGVGPGINPAFMTTVTGSGKLGVFASAPEGKDISTAYEEVFGYALETRMSFSLEVDQGDGPVVKNFGLLIKERSVLIDIKAPKNDSPGEHTFLKVTLLNEGNPVGDPCSVSAEWTDAKDPSNQSEKVKDALERQEVEDKMIEIQRTSRDIDHASRRMRHESETMASEGAYGAAALRRMDAMVQKTESESAAYRSLGPQSSAIYASKAGSQAMYEY